MFSKLIGRFLHMKMEEVETEQKSVRGTDIKMYKFTDSNGDSWYIAMPKDEECNPLIYVTDNLIYSTSQRVAISELNWLLK